MFILKHQNQYLKLEPLNQEVSFFKSKKEIEEDTLTDLYNQIAPFFKKENADLYKEIINLKNVYVGFLEKIFDSPKKEFLVPFAWANDKNKAGEIEQDLPLDDYREILIHYKNKQDVTNKIINHFTAPEEKKLLIGYLKKKDGWRQVDDWSKSKSLRQRQLAELARLLYPFMHYDGSHFKVAPKILNFIMDNYSKLEKIETNNYNQFFMTKMYAVFSTAGGGFLDFQKNIKPLNEARTFANPEKAAEWIKSERRSTFLVCEIEGKITNPNYYKANHSSKIINEIDAYLNQEEIQKEIKGPVVDSPQLSHLGKKKSNKI